MQFRQTHKNDQYNKRANYFTVICICRRTRLLYCATWGILGRGLDPAGPPHSGETGSEAQAVGNSVAITPRHICISRTSYRASCTGLGDPGRRTPWRPHANCSIRRPTSLLRRLCGTSALWQMSMMLSGGETAKNSPIRPACVCHTIVRSLYQPALAYRSV
jgi:hypothetical protein